MRLLLDTNIVVDILTKRSGYEDSLTIFRYCEAGRVEGMVSATTVTDVMYILRKHIDPSSVRDAVQTLLAIVDVAGVMKADIVAAFASDMTDYEDAVQSSCAVRNKVDYIIARNIKGFEKSIVPEILPGDMLKLK